MSKKILFCMGEGIGNVIQTVPTIRTLVEVLGYEVDFWHMFGAFPTSNIIPYVGTIDVNKITERIRAGKYEGLVSTLWTKEHIKSIPLKLLNTIKPLTMDRSEVDTYMDIARELGAEHLLWWGGCSYTEGMEEFDVVIADGYNRFGSAGWEIKHYPHYDKVIELLNKEGLSVCSVGAPDEYIKGTVNKTKLPLLKSGGLIKRAKVLISNDSGMYHYANALESKNIVIFTATSIPKNYDSRFHKYSAVVVRDDLDCSPCQAGRGWKRCKDWKCRDIDPEVIMEKVKEIL